MIRLDGCALSEMGPEDDVNDDAWALDAVLGVFAVADGMGGLPDGARASHLATQVFMQEMHALDAASRVSESHLRQAVAKANGEILAVAAADPLLAGLGTTLVAAVMDGAQGKVVHVGDSRAYLYRGGKLTQLTRDHSLVAELVEGDRLSPEAAASHPLRNVLSRHLGSENHAEPDFHDVCLEPDDWLVLCTDGVTKALSTEDLEHVVRKKAKKNAEKLCRGVMDAALARRPQDDVTLMVVRLGGK